jgi:hypothetical protein
VVPKTFKDRVAWSSEFPAIGGEVPAAVSVAVVCSVIKGPAAEFVSFSFSLFTISSARRRGVVRICALK